MSEEDAVVETETTPDVPEEQQPEEESKESYADESQDTEVEETEEAKSEEVDETGVPVKNRLAEANRKLRRAKEMTQPEAKEAILKSDVPEDEAIRIVEDIVDKRTKKALEPLLVEQFLNRNPDAASMVDDINRVRAEHPELSSVDQLELAYKVVKADRQDEIVRKRVELQQKEAIDRTEKSNQSAIEGTTKRTPALSLDDKIKNAKTLEELREIESILK